MWNLPESLQGTLDAMSHKSSIPFSSARKAIGFRASSKQSRRLKSTASSCIFPASILEKSRMSLITPALNAAPNRVDHLNGPRAKGLEWKIPCPPEDAYSPCRGFLARKRIDPDGKTLSHCVSCASAIRI